MIRAVVGTNIIVSGLLFGGPPSKVVNAAIDRRFIWVTSPHLIAELERVLGYKKFDLSEHEVKILLTPLIEISEVIISTTTVDIIERCPADNGVLECAVDGKCSFIVTGDRRDLLNIKKFRDVDCRWWSEYAQFMVVKPICRCSLKIPPKGGFAHP